MQITGSLPSSAQDSSRGIDRRIAEELGVGEHQVAAAVQLLDEGATVPFIARYRKEITGELTDTHLRVLHERLGQLRELEDRRVVVLNSIREQGKLTPELEASILEAATRTRVEDLYLPYRPKRRTKASVAREAGLEPLAMKLFHDPSMSPEREAAAFVNPEKGVDDVGAALEGALHILTEVISEDAALIGQVREAMWEEGVMQSRLVKGKQEEGEKFSDYFEFDQPVKKIPSHRVLALLRGKSLGILRLELEHAQDVAQEGKRLAYGESLIGHHCSIQDKGRPGDSWLKEVVHQAWLKKMKPQMATDLIKRLTEQAQAEAVRVFSANLRDLLLSAPAGMIGVMGLDPGLRTGVKVAVVDKTGKVQITATIYPHQPKNQWQESKRRLALLAKEYGVRLIAIGNGTGSRETDRLVLELKKEHPELRLEGVLVSEAGASVYSASEYGAKEFPDMDVSLRGAVSIARRLQDPLAELVKIDPKAIGVGQYQHDVDARQLSQSLDGVVEDAVNAVGVDVNTASPPLLERVSGLNATLAANIVTYRNEHGPFVNRRALNKVPRFGLKTFELAAGFLRIQNGDTPLDCSAVHPESYGLVERILKKTGLSLPELIGNQKVLRGLRVSELTDQNFGEPTVRDILLELEKPGRDPRPEFRTAVFKEGVEDLKDLQPGMILEGVVSNVTNFGAFVDIGVHQDGLVHISAMAEKFVKDPREVVRAGDIVKVRVMEIDIKRKRVALSMRLNDPMEATDQPKRGPSFNPKVRQIPVKDDLGDNAMAAAFSRAVKRT
ncbi:MAG: RNA-binding transcriptional accessory protein [Nitrospirae bacterium]|nr:RNA-binding transcriptional accessory protein [Magnetococcales bacterium]HAT49044.1 RNA-binding transcriptional accessory protein [Alphaproteobacteria bacterium]